MLLYYNTATPIACLLNWLKKLILKETHINNARIAHVYNTTKKFVANLKRNHQEACHKLIEVIQMSWQVTATINKFWRLTEASYFTISKLMQ